MDVELSFMFLVAHVCMSQNFWVIASANLQFISGHYQGKRKFLEWVEAQDSAKCSPIENLKKCISFERGSSPMRSLLAR